MIYFCIVFLNTSIFIQTNSKMLDVPIKKFSNLKIPLTFTVENNKK